MQLKFKIPGVVVLALWLCLPSANSEPDFSRPKKRLGFSTYQGKIVLWSELQPVQLSDGTLLPLRLRFSSEPNAGAPVFGRFWWCPLLESTVLAQNENTYLLSTLGGRTVFMGKKENGALTSGDTRYSGQIISASTDLIKADGWEYQYVNGRLQSAKREDGIELTWKYDGQNRFGSLVEVGKGPILTLEYSPQEQVPSAITVNQTRYDLTSQEIPVVQNVAGVPLVGGYQSSLASIQGGPVSEKFPIQLDPEGNYTMKYRSNIDEQRDFVWGAASGTLISDGKWTYQISEKEDAPPLVARTNRGGEKESYYYNAKTGESEYLQPDGTLVTRLYFMNGGPNQFKIRKLVKSKNGKEMETQLWSYDEQGRLIRETYGGFERAMSYHENGALAQRLESSEGKQVRLEQFDEQGRIVEKTRRNKTYRYLYDSGKTIVQRMEAGKVIATKVMDPKSSQEFFFLAKANTLSNVVPLFNKTIDPADLAAAESLALKALQIPFDEKNK